jgi:hypothetical protein
MTAHNMTNLESFRSNILNQGLDIYIYITTEDSHWRVTFQRKSF